MIQPKSAYITSEVRVVNNVNGQPQAISLYSRGGDDFITPCWIIMEKEKILKTRRRYTFDLQ